MNELSLFSGAGGGLIGSKLLGWRTIGYVEFNDYCQRVIKARIRDGILDEAPIFGDIKTFISDGYAASYTGMVDVVTGGFPCQPFSVAGKQRGEEDPRNMWYSARDTIRIVRPRYAFLENVTGLLNSGYFGTIISDLSEIGYDAKWTVLGAGDIGAQHKRERLWILAYTKCGVGTSGGYRRVLPQNIGISGSWKDQKVRGKNRELLEMGKKGDSFFDKEPPPPGTMRVVNDVAEIMDRLKAIGNGQVPAVFAEAWEVLKKETP